MSRDRHERSEPKSKLEEKGQLGHRVRRSAALSETVNTSVARILLVIFQKGLGDAGYQKLL